MKSWLKMVFATTAVILSVAVILVISGCQKTPTQEISDAKEAVKGIENEEGVTYASEELRQIKEDLETALDEVKTQDQKFIIKNYDKAKEMLANVKADAENIKIAVSKWKEEARNNALAAQDDAKTVIDEAKTLLAMAPTGKGTQSDIEAFKADLKGIEDSFSEIQQLIDTEKYSAAIDNARIIREKADSITQQIKNAMEKVRVHS